MRVGPAPDFWKYDAAYWFQQTGSSEMGLSQQEVEKILKKQGIQPRTYSRLRQDFVLFIRQFKSPIMLLMIGAIFISAFVGETSDVLIILTIVLSSGFLSFFQERNAGRVVEKLKSMLSIKSTVLRNGSPQDIPAGMIVPGDVILFNAGDLIPADCLLFEADELHANESSLTGESFPVRKSAGLVDEQADLVKRTNCLWEGTNIVSGTGKALVIQTGEDTLFGAIARSATTVTETSFEKGLKDFGYFLTKITLVLSIFILIVNLLNGKGIIDSALFALALAVGMAPELLPAISSIAMSQGANRLLQKKVIVKKLSAIQNLGEINLLCTDKTGTITEGTIRVSGLKDPFGQESELVKQLAYWNASLESGYSNPIDEALKLLLVESKKIPEKIGEVPYDFIRKRLSIGVRTEVDLMLISKGAFSQILSICTQIRLPDGKIAGLSPFIPEIENRFEEYGKLGARVIAICYKNLNATMVSKELEVEMIFAGFILLQDPVKKGIVETIGELKKLKVGLKIITGDNRNVALAISQSIGIENPMVLTGKDLMSINPEALKQLVRNTHVFSEVEPQQKERIILALKHSFTVAYMGDGINDVSAINAADVGISVENAVDVAREAADFVLTEKNILVLVDGIKEGRKTFANTLKYLYISTGSTFGNMFSVAGASLILPFLPMLPKQILLTNLLSDFPFITIASDSVEEEQLKKPGKWDLKVIRKYMLIFGFHSAAFDIISFFTLFFLLKSSESEFQTGWFIESIISELFILFIIRTHRKFYQFKPSGYLMAFSIFALTVTLGLPYLPFAERIGLAPLPFTNLAAIGLILLAYVLTGDILKVWFFKKHRNI
ncbi:magnesium-translocating P-type ATPase [Algoriphagus lacus]|uniref:Magnesium-transporting ATPase, P-type 1 n=1 Tax=Algoriphagus lacus TaxID=2056311 RepID=A0A418PQG7_9BACT|nr:magnesium-translocating P-type ATPase [Algoriphagus lacus]RIW14546.1 magnesium-translocating P-type ATPase [Algoriphagus lacus]